MIPATFVADMVQSKVEFMTHLTSEVIIHVLPDCCNFQLRDIFILRCLYYIYSQYITIWAIIWLIQAYCYLKFTLNNVLHASPAVNYLICC